MIYFSEIKTILVHDQFHKNC